MPLSNITRPLKREYQREIENAEVYDFTIPSSREAGTLHPNVLEMGGIDSERYTGFAFGLGMTRLAMMTYNILLTPVHQMYITGLYI